jgi:hypothetical protein
VETNVERVALPNRWRTQIAGRTEQVAGQRIVVGRVVVHVDRHDLLSLGDVNGASGPGQGQRFRPALPKFAGIGAGLNRYLILLKEPLSFFARRSALAVIHPVNRLGHADSPSVGLSFHCIGIPVADVQWVRVVAATRRFFHRFAKTSSPGRQLGLTAESLLAKVPPTIANQRKDSPGFGSNY